MVTALANRRAHERFEVSLPVEIEYRGFKATGRTKNLSIGGMYLETPNPFSLGDSIRVRFAFPRPAAIIEVDAVVRWVDGTPGDSKGAGIQFVGLRAKHAWAFNRFFSGKAGLP